MSVRRAAAFYFAVQGIAVVVWWAWLIFVPSSRAYFQTNGTTEAALLAFWLPDLLLVACGSFVAAYFCVRDRDNIDARIAAALWLVCGAVGYATLYCLASALLTDSAWLSVALMLPAMLLSVSSTLAVSPLGKSVVQAGAGGWSGVEFDEDDDADRHLLGHDAFSVSIFDHTTRIEDRSRARRISVAQDFRRAVVRIL